MPPAGVATKVIGAVAARYRQLDPSRPVAMHEPRGEDIEALVDVVGLGVGKETDGQHQRFPHRPYLVAEYSASTMGRGIYGGGPESEDLACENHEKYLRELYRRPWMAGGMIWHQFDYEGETYDTVIPHIVAFGMGDVYRIPKDVYYFYQSQWTAQPMVHILGHWTWPAAEGTARTVKVFSNAAEVECRARRPCHDLHEPIRAAEFTGIAFAAEPAAHGLPAPTVFDPAFLASALFGPATAGLYSRSCTARSRELASQPP